MHGVEVVEMKRCIDMIRTWCHQIRFNKPKEYIPRGFRLLTSNGIKEWDGEKWIEREVDEVAILSVGKVRIINEI